MSLLCRASRSALPSSFLVPIVPIGGRSPVSGATVMMPKTPMNENRQVVFRQHHVRLARQFLDVQPITKAFGPNCPPNVQLWARVLPVDPGHHTGAVFRGNSVGHGNSILAWQLRAGADAACQAARRWFEGQLQEDEIIAVAERAGFEPARSLRPYAISSRARSSTPAPLRAGTIP